MNTMTLNLTRFRRCASVLAVLSFLLGSGCVSSGPSEQERRAAKERVEAAHTFTTTLAVTPQRVSIVELDQLTYGYADRYYMVISSAVDAIKRNNPDPVQRRLADQIELQSVLAMDDIVSSDDPYARTLDLVVSVTLESTLLIDENQAEQDFGARAPVLISAFRTMRVEAWQLAARTLNQEQLELLDYIILEWRRTHPNIDQVAYVKFDNFAGARAAGLLEGFKAGDGFLAPLSEANETLKDWQRLTERAFWYSKRAPNIAALQAEVAVNEMLSSPEINSAFRDADRLTKTAEAAPQTIDDQRKAFFAQLDARQTLLTNTLGDVRHIVADANSLGNTVSLLTTNTQQTLAAFSDTLKVADEIGRHYGLDQPSSHPPARPFDIRDYTAALVQLNEVVTNLHQLSVNADQLTRSEGWNKMLRDMTDATDRRVDRAFTRVCLALVLAFLLAVIYRFISLRLQAKMTRPPKEKL
ncbi:MAG TPA: hypothetical protein VMJ12_13045 [Candidatus Acidoferrales bacterium]|nr:hypothetical protein [Candidatus Acidoferrales bacterium]